MAKNSSLLSMFHSNVFWELEDVSHACPVTSQWLATVTGKGNLYFSCTNTKIFTGDSSEKSWSGAEYEGMVVVGRGVLPALKTKLPLKDPQKGKNLEEFQRTKFQENSTKLDRFQAGKTTKRQRQTQLSAKPDSAWYISEWNIWVLNFPITRKSWQVGLILAVIWENLQSHRHSAKKTGTEDLFWDSCCCDFCPKFLLCTRTKTRWRQGARKTGRETQSRNLFSYICTFLSVLFWVSLTKTKTKCRPGATKTGCENLFIPGFYSAMCTFLCSELALFCTSEKGWSQIKAWCKKQQISHSFQVCSDMFTPFLWFLPRNVLFFCTYLWKRPKPKKRPAAAKKTGTESLLCDSVDFTMKTTHSSQTCAPCS